MQDYLITLKEIQTSYLYKSIWLKILITSKIKHFFDSICMQDYTLTFDIQQSWRDDRLVLGRDVLGKDKYGNDMSNITLDGRTINQIWVRCLKLNYLS